MTPHTPVRQRQRGPVHHPRHASSTRCLPHQEGRPMNISRNVHAASLRVIILAPSLPIARLLFAAGQAGSSHATAARTTHASTATCAADPHPTLGLAQGVLSPSLKRGSGVPSQGSAGCSATAPPAGAPAVLAPTQSPVAFSAGSVPSGAPAWQKIPSGDLSAPADPVIPPAEQLFM